MARVILLDTGVVGLLCLPPDDPRAVPGRLWLARLFAAEIEVTIPEIADDELRRELLRIGSATRLARLESLRDRLLTSRVAPEAWRKAAEFWAILRRGGRPTANPHALDGDAILAGVAATMGSPADLVTIATTNVGHLARFPGIDARSWESIGGSPARSKLIR